MARIKEIFYKCRACSVDLHIHSHANYEITKQHIRNSTQQTTQKTIRGKYNICDISVIALHENYFSKHLISTAHFSNMDQRPKTFPLSELSTREESELKQPESVFQIARENLN